MEIKPLANIGLQLLLDTFNRSFSDYLVPFQLTMEQLKQKLFADKTDLNLSVGVFEGDALVGFILHAYQYTDGQNTIYNGGTGVIPEKRGLGLVGKQYDYILPKLLLANTDCLLLEVIAENTPAIKAYTKLGFTINRKLWCYKGQIQPKTTIADCVVQKITQPDWELFRSFWDITPSWQNSVGVLQNIAADCQILGAYSEGQLRGYVIFSPEMHKICQFAVAPAFRNKGVGTLLFNAVQQTAGTVWTILNVDESARETHRFLKNSGFEAFIAQFEMQWQLTN